MATPLRAFGHRNYRLFFGGQAVSLVGTWMQQVAQGWLVLQLTGDPLWLGAVATAQYGPAIALGLFGGVVADHLPKRRILVVTQTVSMVLAFVLFALTATHVVQVWHVMVLAVILGMANAIEMPTRQAFAVDMVGREDMANAVGLNSAMFNGSRIVGPAVAGVLIGATDISLAFLVNGISFLAVIAAYLVMREDELHPVEAMVGPTTLRGILDELAGGARYVRNTPLVLLAVTVVGLVATFGLNFQVLTPPLADHVLHVGASGFGFLMAASGVGSTIAALAIAFSHHVRPRLMAIGAMALGLGSIGLAWSNSFLLSLALMVIAGAGGIAMMVTANTTIQSVVPDRLRGRVISVYTTVFSASVPAGGLLMGGVAKAWGVPAAFGIGGALSATVAAGAWLWLGRIRAAERPAHHGPIGDAHPPTVGGDAPV